jgi:hypothetical protein
MKLTKDRFSCWEQVGDEDYEKDFDDELIIKIYPSETSKQIADYILECQEKADDYDKMVNITFDLTNRVKKYENEYQPMNELIKENKELRKLLSVFEDES